MNLFTARNFVFAFLTTNEDFAAALMNYPADLDGAPRKSDLESGYDFYHDLVLRHVAEDGPALLWLGLDRRWQRLSYRALHGLCTQRRDEWTRRGVRAAMASEVRGGGGACGAGRR